MDGFQREDQHNQPKICTCKPLIDNSNTFRNNDLQLNVNPTTDNDSNLSMHVDESTSQNTSSNNGSQNKNVPLNQHVPIIDLSLEENITEDGKVTKEEKQETNNKKENFIMQCGSKMAAHNNDSMAGNLSNNEEMDEFKDLPKSTAKKGEVYEVPQNKIETVSDNGPKLNKSIKHSVIDNVTVNEEMDNNTMQTHEVKSEKNNNEKKLDEHASDIIATELLSGGDVKLFGQENTETVKSTKDQFIQTDNIKNDQFSDKETQTNTNNYTINNEMFLRQLHSVVNRNLLQYRTMLQNAIQEFFTPFQIVFFPDGTVPGNDVMRRQAVRHAVPATMQAGLPFQHHPSTSFGISRRAAIHHPYMSQHNIRLRNQIHRIIQQANVGSQPYRQNSGTQTLETEMANNNQNHEDQQRQ